MDSILGDMTEFFDKKAEESGNIVCSTVPVTGLNDSDTPVENSKLTLFYKKLEQLNYNLDELKPILECDDSMLILSGAGSGKTTALILKVIRDLIAGDTMKTVQVGDSYFMTPANILICTFLRTGAEELQKSFGDWLGKLGIRGIDKENIKFRTIHSEVLDALKGMGMDVKILEDGSSYMRQVMQSYGIRSVLSTGKTVTADEVSDMMLITNYARNRMDNRKYEHSLMSDYGLDTMTLDVILTTYAQHRKASGKMDFEDMQEILLDGLQKYERVREYIASRYDYIYVDEFQDTSQLQYEILKYYFDSAKRVLCIGDDDQCIVKGSKVKTLNGIKNIEDVVVGDKVLSATGHGTVDYMPVNHVSEKIVNEKVYRVTTASGKTVTATGEHTAFVNLGIGAYYSENVELRNLTDSSYMMMPFSNLRKGMYMPVEINGTLVDDVIVNIEKIDYNGSVYDLSVPDTVNFIVDDVCVHNCIYSWRGSDIDIIGNRFEDDYKPTVKNLSVNYRCAANILAPVIPSIEKNSKRHDKKLRAARSGGTVTIHIDEDVNKLIEEVNKDIDRGYSTAILARTNNDLLVPAILLELNSKHNGGGLFSLSKAISLTSRIPKQVFGVMDLLLKRYTADFESYFKLFLPKYDQREAETLSGILAINKRLDIFSIDKQDLVHSVPNLANFIEKLAQAKEDSPVTAYIHLLNLMSSQVYNGKSVYAQRAKDFVFFIKKIIMEHDEVKDMNLEELHTLFTETLPAKFNKRINSKQRTFIKLTTVHEAKGKEWDSVYIWNDFDGCFPNCVGGRELSPDEFEEERRVHYIAWTRARKKLTVFTLSERMNGGFLKECVFDDYAFEDVMGDDLQSKVVFRRKDVSQPEKLSGKDLARKLLSDYIVKYSGGSVKGSKEGNCNLVIGEYSTDELWNKIESEGAVYAYIEMDDVESYFSDFFERLAGDIIGNRLDDISDT